MEVGPSFMAKAHSGGGERAECGWHRQIEQQLKKVEEELRHRHRCLTSLLNTLRLSDEALGHASKTRDHHQGNAGARIKGPGRKKSRPLRFACTVCQFSCWLLENSM